MSFGIDVAIDITIQTRIHNSYLIISLSSDIELDKLGWSVGLHVPIKRTILDGGKSLVLYFLMSDVSMYGLNGQLIQGSFVGSDLLAYLTVNASASELVPTSGSSDMSSVVGGMAIASSFIVIGIVVAKVMA